MKRVLSTVVITLVVLGVIGVAGILAGFVNVGADNPDPSLVRWVLVTARDASIERRAESISLPDLDAPGLAEEGVRHYRGMCAGCHGAPGVEQGRVARAMNPPPPDLKDVIDSDEDAREAFWVIKHGIKMTGMPAFGGTDSDQELWSVVSFIKRMRTMTPEEYQTMLAAAGGQAEHARPDEAGETGHAGEKPRGSGEEANPAGH